MEQTIKRLTVATSQPLVFTVGLNGVASINFEGITVENTYLNIYRIKNEFGYKIAEVEDCPVVVEYILPKNEISTSTLIRDLDFGTKGMNSRLANAIRYKYFDQNKEGVTIENVLNLGWFKLLQLRNIGKNTVLELKNRLQSLGFELTKNGNA